MLNMIDLTAAQNEFDKFLASWLLTMHKSILFKVWNFVTQHEYQKLDAILKY